jgi:hypothetical protein
VSTSFEQRQISVWLASFGATSPPSRVAMEKTIQEIVELQGLFDQVCATLARSPRKREEARPLVEQLLRQRHELMARLGEGAMSWLAAGGQLELRSGSGSESIGPGLAASAHAPAEASTRATESEQPAPALRAAEVLPPDAAPAAPALVPPDAPAHPSAAVEGREADPAGGQAPGEQPAQVASETARAVASETAGEVANETTSAAGGEAGERVVLRSLLDLAGRPRDLTVQGAIADELDGLEAFADSMGKWPLLPRPLQRQLLAMLVARLRAVKDMSGLSPGVRLRVKDTIALCPPYAKQHPLGAHVNGLQLAHVPEGATWRSDALDWWDELEEASRKG